MRILIEKKLQKYRCTIFLFCFLCVLSSLKAQENSDDKKDSSDVKEEIEETRSVKPVLMGEQLSETSVQAISTVSGERLLHRPVFLMESFMEGTLPGLYVDMSQGYTSAQRTLRLRGRTPLIVVDGIPRSDANVPASQIESISILKDAVGLSMMGMSSGNGVLYIKTKRGSATAMKIDFTAQLAFAKQIYRPDFLGSYDYANLLNKALVNDGRKELYSERDLDLYKSGASPYTHPNVDWYDELMREYAPTQQYNLNISGGTKSARYFIDLNMFDQDGFLKQDKSLNSYDTRDRFRKYSLRTNTDIAIGKYTMFRVNLFGQMYRETTPGKAMMGGIYAALHTTPNNSYPKFNPNGTLGGNFNYTDNNLYGQSILSGYNMYTKSDINIDLILEQNLDPLLKGLYASATYSYNSSYRETLDRSKNFNTFMYWKDPNDQTEDTDANYIRTASGSAQKNDSKYDRINRMQYLELAAGYDFEQDGHTAKTKVIYSYNEFIAKFLNLPLSKNGISYRTEYDYNKRFLAEFSFSAMNMNQLKPGEKWGWFPAVGIGWNIAKEDWFTSSAINSLKLRTTYGLNASDGSGSYYRSGGGTLANYYYSYMQYYKLATNSSGTVQDVYFGNTKLGEKYLIEAGLPYITKWEKIKRLNVGVDLEAFDRTLHVTAEFFHNTFSDILQKSARKTYNGLIGIDLPNENLGKFRQNGLELNVDYNNKFGDITVSANANAVIYRTKLMNNDENKYPESSMQRVGKSTYQIFGHVANGFFQSQQDIDNYLSTTKIEGYIPKPGDIKYVDLNKDGILDERDIKEIGTKSPRIEYGMFLGAEWKGIEFSMQWSGLANHSISSIDTPFGINYKGGYAQASKEHLDTWAEENPNARYPRVTATPNHNNEKVSSFWVKNAAYLRLKNIELAYTLPKKWTSSLHMSRVKVFTNAYNLVTLTGMKDRDPELEYMSGNTGIVPNTKAFNFGLNIQF